MSKLSIIVIVGEEHCDFGEMARFLVQFSPVAEIRIRSAAPYAAEPPEPPCGAGEWHPIRQTVGRQRQSGNSIE